MNPHQYPVGLEIGLHELKTELIFHEREHLQIHKDASGKTAKTKKPNAGEVAESVSEKKQNLSAKEAMPALQTPEPVLPPSLPGSLENPL